MKYPMLTKVLAEANQVDAGWKENLSALLITLFTLPSFAGTKDLHNAVQGLDGKKIGSVKIEVKKNSGGVLYLKIGDFSIRGTAVGFRGNVRTDLSVYGPNDPSNSKGYEEAKFLMEKISEADELRE